MGNCAILTVSLMLAMPESAPSQTRLPFLGTWKLDVEEIEDQMKRAGVGARVIAQRTARLRQRRIVLGGDGKGVEIRDGFPTRFTWELLSSNHHSYKLQTRRGGRLEELAVKMDGSSRMIFLSPEASHPPVRFIRVSDREAVVVPEALTIGAKAPPIQVEHWSGESQFSGSFEAGHTYLLDFWATWCPPCIKAMPELARLRDEFRDGELTVIAISNEPPEIVEAFLRRKLPRGTKDAPVRTFAEATAGILIAADPDGTTVRDYLVAANQRALPVSMIVGPTGRVEWIGHILGQGQEETEDVLRRVIGRTWNRTEFARVFAGRQRVQVEHAKVRELIAKGSYREANQLIEELIPLADDSARAHLLELQRSIQAAVPRARDGS